MSTTETETIHKRAKPKVPPYARYRGTSAWRKDRRRARAYAWWLANEKAKRDKAA